MKRRSNRDRGRKTASHQEPTAVDLFCGAGGLTEGLKQAGFRVAAAVDSDSLAVESYRVNHPEVHVWERDIRRLSIAETKRRLPDRRLDLLAGCPPCQGFSLLRTRNGSRRVRDPRNSLILEFLRFVRGLRPRTVMLENVPRLAKTGLMKEFCRGLRREGYLIEYRIVDAADHGVPQRRRRLILLGARGGKVAFPPARPGRHGTVRTAIGRLGRPSRSPDPLHNLSEVRSSRITSLIRRVPVDGGSRMDLGDESQLACHREVDGFHDIYGRMAWDQPAPTITGGCINPSKGRFLHPCQHRAITLREAAYLQSFPRGYFFSLARGKYRAAELIGNALPPRLVRDHASSILVYLAAEDGASRETR